MTGAVLVAIRPRVCNTWSHDSTASASSIAQKVVAAVTGHRRFHTQGRPAAPPACTCPVAVPLAATRRLTAVRWQPRGRLWDSMAAGGVGGAMMRGTARWERSCYCRE
eukprot:TRINITY_DN10153_c0_g1_i1.p4 TRINITY_DN10153_c0_g1~~TRINITY_DN10153_c0_g1_i1.p4  ORF type:complete len:108 (+),score=0.53 TRINITY_DN10153_c0_g1_i1:311-634(+)